MHRTLYLLRHAQSADKQVSQQDRDRELTPEGMKQALRIGGFFLRQKLPLDCIMTSYAVRANTTAGYVADVIKYDPEKILVEEELYEASVRTFFQFVTNLDDSYRHILCVGHNPTISYLAEFLTRAEIGDMVPAGLCMIQFNLDTWKEVSQGNGTLIQYVHPDALPGDLQEGRA